MILNDVPFYENPDDTHCFQASFRMILKHFTPTIEFTWGQIDQMTGYKKNIATWPTYGLIWLQRNGFEIVYKELFDHERFVEEGELYILEKYGPEMGQWQIDNSIIPQEIYNTRELLRVCKVEQSVPSLDELKEYLKRGYLLLCNVNGKVLIDEDGYIGHWVVIVGYTKDSIILNDPGRPGTKQKEVSNEKFLKAWAYPTEKEQGLLALRLNTREHHPPHG